MATGYLALVHDYRKTTLIKFLLIITQLEWVLFITEMSGVGIGLVSDPGDDPFIRPPEYNAVCSFSVPWTFWGFFRGASLSSDPLVS